MTVYDTELDVVKDQLSSYQKSKIRRYDYGKKTCKILFEYSRTLKEGISIENE